MARRAIPYAEAVRWIWANDDISEIQDWSEYGSIISVCLVADIYGRETEEVIEDIRKLIKKENA